MGNHPNIGGLGGWETMPTEDPSGEFIGGYEVGPGDLVPGHSGPSTGSGLSWGSGSSTDCPDCCWDWFKGCTDLYGKSRYCWHQMCCCPGSYVRFPPPCYEEKMNGSLPEDFNCREACCDPDNYPDLGPGQDYSSYCGGSTKGSCFRNNPDKIRVVFSDFTSPLEVLIEGIEKMCQSISDTGCLLYCGDSLFCACLMDFCDCTTSGAVVIYDEHLDKSQWRFWDPWGVYVKILSINEWADLLHELIHHCMWRYGLHNLETRARACERTCVSNKTWRDTYVDVSEPDKYKDVSPCCCGDSVSLPNNCKMIRDRYNPFETTWAYISSYF
jgi:hypothetical protein